MRKQTQSTVVAVSGAIAAFKKGLTRHNYVWAILSNIEASLSGSHSLLFKSQIQNWLGRSCLLLLSVFLCANVQAAQILLLIDDMGNKASDARAFDLPNEVAFAILPHTPFSERFSHQANDEARDIILHMPMEALSGLNMGPGGISSEMSNNQIKALIASAHQSVPGAIGMNNHMGSKLTQLTRPMQAAMEYLTSHQMFFLDSRTTRFSRAEKIARTYGIPVARRHVFLDHVQETGHIDFQFRRLIHKAKKQGFAIGIGHPHQVTLDYLLAAITVLEAEGVTLVTIRDKFAPAQQQWAWNQPGQLSR